MTAEQLHGIAQQLRRDADTGNLASGLVTLAKWVEQLANEVTAIAEATR